MKLLNTMVALSALGFAAAGIAGPQNVTITTVSANGSGCPDGSTMIDISPDRQVFTAIFSKFQAVIDPGNPSINYADRQKRCDLSLRVHVPNGWQFSVFKADYEGWYDLQQNMQFVQTSTYHFQGNARHAKSSTITTQQAPKSGNFRFEDKVGTESVEWSACGGPRNLLISAEIRLSSANPHSRGAAGIDAIEGQFKMLARFGLNWRQCQ